MCSRAGTYWRHLVTLVLSPLFINIRVRDADSTCLDRKTNCWRETLQAAHHDPASHHLGIAAARLQTKLHLPESKACLFAPTFQHICRCLNPHILLIWFFGLQLCNYTELYDICCMLSPIHPKYSCLTRGWPTTFTSRVVSVVERTTAGLSFVFGILDGAGSSSIWSLFVSWALMLPVDTARRIHVMFFQFCLLELHGVKLEVVIGWFLAVHYFDKCCIVAYRSILHFV